MDIRSLDRKMKYLIEEVIISDGLHKLCWILYVVGEFRCCQVRLIIF